MLRGDVIAHPRLQTTVPQLPSKDASHRMTEQLHPQLQLKKIGFLVKL